MASKVRPKRKHLFLLLLLLVLCSFGIWFAARNFIPGLPGASSSSSTPTVTPQPGNYPFVIATTIPNPVTGAGYLPAALVPLNQLNWCRYNTQLPRFWDYGGSASSLPQIVTNWAQIQSQLGFPIYLPAKLSADACLTGVEGILNNPAGNTFRITYDYYQRAYVNRFILFEQATQASTKLQCAEVNEATTNALESTFPGVNATSSNPAASICTGQQGQTAITFQAPESTQQLATDFQSLQPQSAFFPICNCQNTNEHIFRVHV